MPAAKAAASAKKQKVEGSLDTSSQSKISKPSKIFSPFRSIGNVTNSVPFSITSLGQTFVITTCVGNFFQIYDASSLHLLFVSSPKTPSPITAIYSHFHYVFAAWNSTIGIFKRGKLEATIELDSSVASTGPIKSISLFGEHLCAATETAVSVIKVNPKTPSENPEHYTIINIPKSFGKIKQIVHPHTYLNKIAIVVDSSILLYNVRTGRLLFSSEPTPSPVTCIEPSPVLDVIAIGTASGEIQLYHLKQGRVLFTLNAGARITSLSFRTDGTPLLGAGTATGDLLFYHLDTKKRIHILRSAHREENGGVSTIHFFNGQPIFLTNGGDNKLCEYVFDPSVIKGNDDQAKASVASISAPRLLRSRGGHSLPPSFISFTDDEAHFILSASRDQSLWSFSLRKDAQSYEFSQKEKRIVNGKVRGGILGSMTHKLPEITSLSYEKNKQGRWDNILTAHKDRTYAQTWDGKRGIIGPNHLATSDGGIVKTTYVSSCGNFAVIGSSLGGVAVYNLQSGLIRKQFVGHTQAITGTTMDSLNTVLITASLDGYLKFYDFHKNALVHKMNLGSSATSILLHQGSDLLAVSLDNLSIVVVDIRTRKVVRELWGHTNRITSFDFSPDGRWIISASLDATIRTWDLPTGGCIDVVKVESNNIVTCLKMSPNGDWLATAHVQGVGVNMWTNRAQFKNVNARIITEEDEERDGIETIEMPNVAGEGGANIIEGALDTKEDDNDSENLGIYNTVDQLSDDLVTLSMLPKSKFNTLTHLEAIKKRNKPKQPAKKPEKMPFFLGLPTSETDRKGTLTNGKLPGNTPSLATDASFGESAAVTEDANDNGAIYLRKDEKLEFESEFTRLLRLASEQVDSVSMLDSSNDEEDKTTQNNDAVSQFISYLKSLSPSSTDLELRSLRSYAPLTEIISFIKTLTASLRRHRDYELVQAWMAMLLRIHSDVILAHSQKKDKKKSASSEEGSNSNNLNGGAAADSEDEDELMINSKSANNAFENEGSEDEEEEDEWNVYLPELVEALNAWEAEQRKENKRIEKLAMYCSGVIDFLKIA